jgi:hypothetical protein
MFTSASDMRCRQQRKARQQSDVESLERRRLLTATPTLVGVTVDDTSGRATFWMDATADSGSATIRMQGGNGSGNWTTFGTTAGGLNSWALSDITTTSNYSEFRLIAIDGGIQSSPSSVISRQAANTTPVAPTVENPTNTGSDFEVSWTASTAYVEGDTLRLQYATTTTAGTTWNDYLTTDAASNSPTLSISLDTSQTTQFRMRVEDSTGNSSWSEFQISGQ